MKDDNIPVLIDLIEDTIDITEPQLGIDPAQDLLIETSDDLPVEKAGSGIEPKLEQTIRQILNEHMELALQEICLAIQVSRDKE